MPEIGQILSHCSLVDKIARGMTRKAFPAKPQKHGRDAAIKIFSKE